MLPAGTVNALNQIQSISETDFGGFTPTICAVDCKVYTPGAFVIYIDIPVFPTGPLYTTDMYAAGLRDGLGPQYSVAVGMLYISIEYKPS
jgi:hypothetical protein